MVEMPQLSLEILDPCHRGIPRRTAGRISLGSPPRANEVNLDGDALC
jgi:hypothetical protein